MYKAEQYYSVEKNIEHTYFSIFNQANYKKNSIAITFALNLFV